MTEITVSKLPSAMRAKSFRGPTERMGGGKALLLAEVHPGAWGPRLCLPVVVPPAHVGFHSEHTDVESTDTWRLAGHRFPHK